MVDDTRRAARRNGVATAKELRDEAARLFWEKGFAATTTRELAESLGVQKASLYYHMASKEQLLYDICVESLDDIRRAVVRSLADERDPLARVKAMIGAHVVSMLENKEKHATMLTELKCLSSPRREEIVRLRDEYEALLRGVISEAQDAGRLSTGASSKDLGLGLCNLLNWTIFWYRPDGELSPEALAGLLETLYLDGAVRKGAPGTEAVDTGV